MKLSNIIHMEKTMDSNKGTIDIENQQGDDGGDNREDNCRVRGDVCGSNAIVSLAFAIAGFYVLFKHMNSNTDPEETENIMRNTTSTANLY
tara:strand:+ start:209 stop:481 length:273 start_codon:yes stop_codon:yes gene_type:complete